MHVEGSLTKAIKSKRKKMALIVVHLQSKSKKSRPVIEVAKQIVKACVSAGSPIFLMSQVGLVMQIKTLNGIIIDDACKILPEIDGLAKGTHVVRITAVQGNVFADTDLEQQLRKLGCQDVVVIGVDGVACVRATAVGAPSSPGDRPDDPIRMGATHRGFEVHTHHLAICSESLPSSAGLPWLARPGVRSYSQL